MEQPQVPEGVGIKRPSCYPLRVSLRAHVKRTGKSQDYLVRHSHIGCVKCGRVGICNSSRQDRAPSQLSTRDYLADL